MIKDKAQELEFKELLSFKINKQLFVNALIHVAVTTTAFMGIEPSFFDDKMGIFLSRYADVAADPKYETHLFARYPIFFDELIDPVFGIERPEEWPKFYTSCTSQFIASVQTLPTNKDGTIQLQLLQAEVVPIQNEVPRTVESRLVLIGIREKTRETITETSEVYTISIVRHSDGMNNEMVRMYPSQSGPMYS